MFSLHHLFSLAPAAKAARAKKDAQDHQTEVERLRRDVQASLVGDSLMSPCIC